MAKEETRVFNGEGKEISAVVEAVQETLKELNQSSKIMQLDKSLIEVQGEPAKGDPIGKLNITIYKEYTQFFIKIKHSMENPDRFWIPFQENMAIYGASDSEIGTKAKVVQAIIDNIKLLGGVVTEEQTWDFLFNFEKQYGHLPNDDEIKNIALKFVKMLDTKEISEFRSETPFSVPEAAVPQVPSGEPPVEGDVTPEDALKAMIDDMQTLSPNEKIYYKKMFPDITVEQQKIVVKKLIEVDEDMDKIPYISMEDRTGFRENLLNTPRGAKRDAAIEKIIAKRKRQIAFYQDRDMESQLKQILADIPTLSDLDKEIYFATTKAMSASEKEQFIQRLRKAESALEEFVSKGFAIGEVERKHLRDEMVRLNDEELKEYLDNLKADKLKKLVSEELFAEIPSLAFEDYEKYVKELMWLTPAERKAKITDFKQKLGSKMAEKQKLFQESKSVTTCPQCGWPTGQFSKKCPRCGKSLTGW